MATYAESVGWILRQRNPEVYRGSKELEASIGRISITLHDADLSQDSDGPLKVTITLDYDRSVGSDRKPSSLSLIRPDHNLPYDKRLWPFAPRGWMLDRSRTLRTTPLIANPLGQVSSSEV